MNHTERGLYITLLCVQWSQGFISGDDFERIAGVSFSGSLERVKSKFSEGKDGQFRNERLEIERVKQATYRLSRSVNGSKGGRPKKPYGLHMESKTKPYRKPPSPSPSPSPSPDPVTDSKLQSPSVKGAGKQSKLPDSEWIVSLKGNPAYSGIDIDRELGRMQAWASEKRKIPSRARFLNWLNRAEAPLTSNGHTAEKPASIFELKTILQAKENQAKAIKDRFSSEAAMGTIWSDQPKRQEWQTLRKSIRDITNKIANYAIS